MANAMDETKATAHLPNLDIEIRHRVMPDEGAEYVTVSLRAAPSFDAVGNYLEACAPFLLGPMIFWLPAFQAAQAFWAPFLPPPRYLPAPPERSEPG